MKKLRDLMKIADDATEKGDLKFTNEKGEEVKEEDSFCPICNKKVTISTYYSWFILDDEEYPDALEMLFCSKECWKKFLEKERKRLEEIDNES